MRARKLLLGAVAELVMPDLPARIDEIQGWPKLVGERAPVIQELLTEAGATEVAQDLVSVDARGVEVAAAWDTLQSPETYLGYERAERFASLGGATADERNVYSTPTQLALNQWAQSQAEACSRSGRARTRPSAH